jgi:hypothetical protein
VHLNLSEDSDHMIAAVKFCCTTHTCSDCIEYDEDCNNITEEVASKRPKNNHPIKYFTDSPNSLISNIHIPPNGVVFKIVFDRISPILHFCDFRLRGMWMFDIKLLGESVKYLIG